MAETETGRNRVQRTAGALFALICAVALGLAAGAFWMVLTVYARSGGHPHGTAWLALPVGLALGFALGAWLMPRGAWAAVLAALATLLAAVYMAVLLAAIRIGGALGIDLVDTLRSAGFELLAQAARLAQRPDDYAWYAGGALLAAITAWLARRPRR